MKIEIETLVWIQLLLTLLIPVALFIGRNWLKANIENSVKHKFDQRIESLKSELRNNEETFKDELRSKEQEISTLREVVFSGRSNRQALLDKRKLEAAEKLWAALVALAPYKALSGMMSRINLERAAKRVAREPNLQKFFETINKSAPEIKPSSNPAEIEQLFVSPLVWAYFSAYKMVVMTTYATARMLELGIEDALKLIDDEKVRDMLKAALPHHSTIIDEHKHSIYFHLLDELEQKLLHELKKTLDGDEADKVSLAQAKEIMDNVNKVKQLTEAKEEA